MTDSTDRKTGLPSDPGDEFWKTLSGLQRESILAAQTPAEYDAVAKALMEAPLPPNAKLPNMKAIEGAVLEQIAREHRPNSSSSS